MHTDPSGPSRATGKRWIAAGMLAFASLAAVPAQAQMPARFYWKSLSGGNAVPLLVESMSGNTNPFDPSMVLQGNGNLDGTIAIAGYARTFSLFDRSAMAAIILPMGRVSGEVSVGGISSPALRSLSSRCGSTRRLMPSTIRAMWWQAGLRCCCCRVRGTRSSGLRGCGSSSRRSRQAE
jgi:hypothetical protein